MPIIQVCATRIGRVGCFVFLAWWAMGCFALLDEKYVLLAVDPESETTNYFRVDLDGSTWLTSSKFSSGFYDRDAVERLFGEQSLESEFLASRVELFGQDGKRLNDLSAQLAASRQGTLDARRAQLVLASGTLAELIGRYEIRLAETPDLQSRFRAALDKATTLRSQGESGIPATPVTDPAAIAVPLARLREAQGYLEAIRVAVDGRVLVRFFDGGGNEINAESKTMVIFVSSDASRFSEAIRQLAEEESAQRDILLSMLGPRMQEARRLAYQVAASDQEEAAISGRLNEIAAPLATGPLAGDVLKQAISQAARVAAGAGQKFEDSSEIEAFIRGLRARQ